MKAKFDERSITIKITEDEMRRLLAGSFLETKIYIGPGSFCIVVDLRAQEESSLSFTGNMSESRLILKTKESEIMKLDAMGKDRDGLLMKSGDIDVWLQVDVRSDSRRRKI